MPLGVGTARGLSTVNNWDADLQRLGQNYYTVLQAKQMREQKIAWMADKMKEGHANTPYTNGKLRPYYDQLNQEVSEFVINNPGFEQDLAKRREFDNLTARYLNNEILREDMLVGEEFNKLRDMWYKGDLRQDQYELEMSKYSAYINQNPDGSDGIKPYIFSNPKTISMDEIVDEASDSLGVITSDVKNKEGWWYRSTNVIAKEVRALSKSILADPLKKEAVYASFKKVEENTPGFYSDVYKYLDDLIENSKNRSYTLLGDQSYGVTPSTDPPADPNLWVQGEILDKIAMLRVEQPDLKIPVKMSAPPETEIFAPVSQDGLGILNPDGTFKNGTPYSTFKMQLGDNLYQDGVTIPGMVKMIGTPTEIMNVNGSDYLKAWVEFDESPYVNVLRESSKIFANAITEIEDSRKLNLQDEISAMVALQTGTISPSQAKKKYKAVVYMKADWSKANYHAKKFQSAENMNYEAPYNRKVISPYVKEGIQSGKANPGHTPIE